jgi:plasmid stability protein
MATLYVENVPDELYEALRKRAKESRKSIAAEVVAMLEENIPTPDELKARRVFRERLRTLRATASKVTEGHFSTEEMQREDRSR